MNRDHVEALTQVGLSPTQILALCLADVEQTIAAMLTGVMACDESELLKQSRVHVQNAVDCLDMLAPAPEHDFATCPGCDQCDKPIRYAMAAMPESLPKIPRLCLACSCEQGFAKCDRFVFVSVYDCEICQAKKNNPPSLGGAGGLQTVPEEGSAPHTVTPEPAGRP